MSIIRLPRSFTLGSASTPVQWTESFTNNNRGWSTSGDYFTFDLVTVSGYYAAECAYYDNWENPGCTSPGVTFPNNTKFKVEIDYEVANAGYAPSDGLDVRIAINSTNYAVYSNIGIQLTQGEHTSGTTVTKAFLVVSGSGTNGVNMQFWTMSGGSENQANIYIKEIRITEIAPTLVWTESFANNSRSWQSVNDDISITNMADGTAYANVEYGNCVNAYMQTTSPGYTFSSSTNYLVEFDLAPGGIALGNRGNAIYAQLGCLIKGSGGSFRMIHSPETETAGIFITSGSDANAVRLTLESGNNDYGQFYVNEVRIYTY